MPGRLADLWWERLSYSRPEPARANGNGESVEIMKAGHPDLIEQSRKILDPELSFPRRFAPNAIRAPPRE